MERRCPSIGHAVRHPRTNLGGNTMHRWTVGGAAAFGMLLAGALSLGNGRPATAQSAERFTLFEMFGRVS